MINNVSMPSIKKIMCLTKKRIRTARYELEVINKIAVKIVHCVLLIYTILTLYKWHVSTALSFRLFSVKRGPPSKNDECLEISHLFRKWLTSTQSFWMHVIASIVSFWGEAGQKYGIPSQPDSQHSYWSGFVVFWRGIQN